MSSPAGDRNERGKRHELSESRIKDPYVAVRVLAVPVYGSASGGVHRADTQCKACFGAHVRPPLANACDVSPYQVVLPTALEAEAHVWVPERTLLRPD